VDDLEPAHRVTVIIWSAMATSLFVYALVAELLAAQNAPFRGLVPAAPVDRLRWVFVALAAAEFAVLGVVARALLEGRPAAAGRGRGPVRDVRGCSGGSRRDLYAFVVVAPVALAERPRAHPRQATPHRDGVAGRTGVHVQRPRLPPQVPPAEDLG